MTKNEVIDLLPGIVFKRVSLVYSQGIRLITKSIKGDK
jgi:hypothetical protein